MMETSPSTSKILQERDSTPFAKVLGPKEGGSGSCYNGVCNPTNSEFYTESIGPAVSRVLEGGVVLTSAYGYSGRKDVRVFRFG